MVRTAHMTAGNAFLAKNFRLQLKRGGGGPDTESKLWVRCSRDGRPFGSQIIRTLGKAGHRQMFVEFGGFGDASTMQFEVGCSDNADVELIRAQIQLEPIGA
jgi:hypothetical protein